MRLLTLVAEILHNLPGIGQRNARSVEFRGYLRRKRKE